MPRMVSEDGKVKMKTEYPVPDKTLKGIVDEAIEIHGKDKFYCLASGGKDSIACTNFMAENYPDYFKGVVHIDTTMGTKYTKQWIKDYCKEMNWDLTIIKPEYDIYRWCIQRKGIGFPAYKLHSTVMCQAKLIPMRNYIKGHKHKDTVSFVSGVRMGESDRRMRSYAHPIDRDGRVWFTSTFFYKSDKEVYRYIHENGLRITPMHDVLGHSADCECGTYGSREELEKVGLVDSELYNRIIGWEDWIDSSDCTSEIAKKHNRWGGNTRYSEEQYAFMVKKLRKSRSFMEDLKRLEEMYCGVECGAGTMKGAGAFL